MAYQFNGGNQFLATSTTPITNGTGNVTLACWFRSSSATTAQALIAIDNIAASGRYILSIEGNVTGKPVVANYGNAFTIVAAKTSTGYTSDTWFHACATYAGNNNQTAYINGGSKVVSTASTSFVSSPTRITIGGLDYSPGGNQALLSGLIAEPAIWNVALSDAEVASLAAGFTPDQIRPSALQFYAPLISNLNDVRGGRAITNNNSATVAKHPRIYT